MSHLLVVWPEMFQLKLQQVIQRMISFPYPLKARPFCCSSIDPELLPAQTLWREQRHNET